jgi:hypothetical protein
VNVGNSVRLAIDDYERGELEASMLHACNAVDGTAAKVYPKATVSRRFTTLLRNSIDILNAWCLPGIDVVRTRFPVRVRSATTSDGLTDLADVVYGIHRCTQGHGDELPEGFGLMPHRSIRDGTASAIEVRIVDGAIQLPDLTIMGLCMVAVAAPANRDQLIPSTYYITWRGEQLALNAWWGREQELRSLIAQYEVPSVVMDFGDWMDKTQ